MLNTRDCSPAVSSSSSPTSFHSAASPGLSSPTGFKLRSAASSGLHPNDASEDAATEAERDATFKLDRCLATGLQDMQTWPKVVLALESGREAFRQSQDAPSRKRLVRTITALMDKVLCNWQGAILSKLQRSLENQDLELLETLKHWSDTAHLHESSHSQDALDKTSIFLKCKKALDQALDEGSPNALDQAIETAEQAGLTLERCDLLYQAYEGRGSLQKKIGQLILDMRQAHQTVQSNTRLEKLRAERQAERLREELSELREAIAAHGKKQEDDSKSKALYSSDEDKVARSEFDEARKHWEEQHAREVWARKVDAEKAKLHAQQAAEELQKKLAKAEEERRLISEALSKALATNGIETGYMACGSSQDVVALPEKGQCAIWVMNKPSEISNEVIEKHINELLKECNSLGFLQSTKITEQVCREIEKDIVQIRVQVSFTDDIDKHNAIHAALSEITDMLAQVDQQVRKECIVENKAREFVEKAMKSVEHALKDELTNLESQVALFQTRLETQESLAEGSEKHSMTHPEFGGYAQTASQAIDQTVADLKAQLSEKQAALVHAESRSHAQEELVDQLRHDVASLQVECSDARADCQILKRNEKALTERIADLETENRNMHDAKKADGQAHQAAMAHAEHLIEQLQEKLHDIQDEMTASANAESTNSELVEELQQRRIVQVEDLHETY